MDELLALFETLEFEEFGRLRLASASWEGGACVLTVDVEPGTGEGDAQRWRVACARCVDYRLAADQDSRAPRLLTPPHALLAPFAEPHAHLYFHGAPADARALAEALHEAHAALSDGLRGLDSFLCARGARLTALLASGAGQLARGPLSRLARYADVARAHGVETSQVAEFRPHGMPDAPEELRALVFGASYVVGAGFSAERVERRMMD
jgi:hypothetical protein